MKILVCGANGFVGSAIAARLEHDGHQVARGVRQPAHPGEIAIDYMSDLTAEQWLAKLGDIDAVVNAVGILTEQGGQTFEHVHTKAPIALFTACRMQGIKHIIQISALDVESRKTPYFASKCAADDFLLAEPSPRAHVIRPSLIYGITGTSARMFRMIASFPVHMLPAGGRQKFRPVHVDDLAELVARLLDPVVESSSRIKVVGNTEITYRGMLDVYRKSMGLASAFTVSIPAWIMRFAATVGGWIPGSILTPDTWFMLQRENTADARQLTDALGRTPRGIETFIGSNDAPTLRAEAFAAWRGISLRIALAIIWIGTALISAWPHSYAERLELLARLNIHGIAAYIELYGACALNFGLGVATLLMPGRRLWLLQMGVILAYSALVAIALPEFLMHPFGPILKNVPLLVILILLYSEEPRP